MVANQAQVVTDLQEEIMDQLRAEPVGVQILVAFGTLFEVLERSMQYEPDETKRTMATLKKFFASLQ